VSALAEEAERAPIVPLSAVADLVRGVSYPKTDAREEPAPGFVPVLRATNIQEARLVLDSDLVFVAERHVSSNQLLRPGDIVVATSSGSKHLVGKSGQLHAPWRGSFGAFCATVRPRPGISPRYLALFLQAPAYWHQVTKKALGVNINNLRRGDLESLELPLPSLTGQASIVAEIEKQFSRLDEAVANLKRVKTNLKRYTAAVLNAAVDGRLVLTEAELARREGRAFETAAEQLARFRGARTDGRHGRVSGEAWGKEATQDLPLLSTGWCWSNFEAVADRVTVGHVGPMKDEYVAEGIPFLRSQNVRPNRYDPEGLKFISPDFHSKLQKSALEPGDILVVRSGSVGVACVVPVSLPVANCSDLVIIKRPRGVLPGYGAFYLNAVVDSRIAAGRVGIALAHFNTKSVANLPVPVPPLAEQARIVAEVDRRLSIVREIDAEAEANLQRAQRFRQATLQAVLGRGL
jgi:type I restriction enzyme S subunit